MAYITTDKGNITMINMSRVADNLEIIDGDLWFNYRSMDALIITHTDIFSLITHDGRLERITAINGNFMDVSYNDTPTEDDLYPYQYRMQMSDDSIVVPISVSSDSEIGASELVIGYVEFGGIVYFSMHAISRNIAEYHIKYDKEKSDKIAEWIARGAGDPYEEGGASGTGGGTGTFSGTGDAIAIPELPTLSATDAGFITLFNPTAGQMAQLANYMWTNPLFDLDNWRKIFADPMDAILGLSIVPVNVPSGGARVVKVGNISTGISMTVASSQYVKVDCGTLNVEEFWGAYLDYEPYTTAEIYLPYCGTHAIKVDDIMGKSVHVVYHVDVLSGGCCCYVQCGGSVLYTFLGQCATSIPITGDNWTRVVNGAIQIASSVGSMVSTGGASFGTGALNIASAAANMVKPSIEKSGAMGGPGGILAVQTPYLILTRPRQALPAGQNTFTGYPSFITETLGALMGYTKVFSVHLEGIPATDSEITEIENLLKGGVIF